MKLIRYTENNLTSRLLLIIIFLACSALAEAQPPEPEEGIRWILNEQFSDEFNDTVLDLNKWYNYHPWWKGRPPAAFLPSQVSLKDGNLVIKNKKLAQDTVIGGTTFSIAGGAVCSRSSSASYGYYEVSMKASEIRMSSTFWMSNRGAAGPDPCSGDRYSLELDIQEAVGGIGSSMEKFRNSMNSNTHYWYTDCNGARNTYSAGSTIPANRELSDTFFVYAAHWVDASKVKLYLNGVQGNTVNFRTDITENPFNRPMQINMVTETYDWVTPPTAEDLADDSRNTTYYDWIRSYRIVPVDYTQTPSELVINGGFETGDFTYWTGWGGNPIEVVSNNQYSGNYCVHIGGPGAPEYEVNLKPGTTYTLSCYGKVAEGSGPIYLGIKDINSLTYGSVTATDTNYTKLSFDFTTGGETSFKFYYYAQNSGDEGYADDFELVEKDGSGDDDQKKTIMFNEKIHFSESPAEKTAGQTVDFLITYMANADRELNLQLFNPDSVLIGWQKYLALAGYGKKRFIMQLDSVPQQGNDYYLMADIRLIDSSFVDTFQTAIYRFDLLNSVDVSITTLDLRDDSPAQGTMVMIGDSTKITDANGIAYFTGVSPGTVTIQGEKEGFVDYSSEFQSIRSDTNLIIHLTPVSYKTTIIISNEYTGESLENASINIDGNNILTDHNGRAIQYLFSGNYPVSVSLERYADKVLSIDISQDTMIYIEMDQTLAEAKFVVKLDSTNLAGASVIIGDKSELTSSIGMVIFYDLKTDTAYIYRIKHNSELLMEDTVKFRADTTLRLYINTAVNSGRTPANNFQLYPNPAHSDIRVLGISGSIEFRIRDMQGRILQEGYISNDGIIDINSLAEGVYILKLEGYKSRQFVIRR